MLKNATDDRLALEYLEKAVNLYLNSGSKVRLSSLRVKRLQDTFETLCIIECLNRSNWVKKRACDPLGITMGTLTRKMERLNIKVKK